MLLSPIVFGISLFVGTIYGCMYLKFITYPTEFEGVYGFTSGTAGLSYLGVGVGTVLALLGFARYSNVYTRHVSGRQGRAYSPSTAPAYAA
jgi:hypothetical protein